MEGKALPDYSGTDAYQVSLTFRAPIIDEAFVVFIRNEQKKRDVSKRLNVFELLALYKICLRQDCSNIDKTLLDKLKNEGLIVKSRDKYRLSKNLYNPGHKTKETLWGIDVEQISVIKRCFEQHETISRKKLLEAFDGILNENQVRYLIEKLVNNNVIKKVGSGKNIQYQKNEEVFGELS